MDIEFNTFDGGLVLASDVEVVASDIEFAQLPFKRRERGSEIEQCADEHIATDTAEDIEIERLHGRIMPPGEARGKWQ